MMDFAALMGQGLLSLIWACRLLSFVGFGPETCFRLYGRDCVEVDFHTRRSGFRATTESNIKKPITNFYFKTSLHGLNLILYLPLMKLVFL